MTNTPPDSNPTLAVHWITSHSAALEPEVFRSQCAIVVADQLASCVQAREAWGSSGHRQPMLVVLLSDTPTREQMLAALGAGVQDVVPIRFAEKFLNQHVLRYLAGNGVLLNEADQWLSVLNAQKAMNLTQIDVDFYREILQNFLDELPLRREVLERDWAADSAKVVHDCHSLQGLARTLGLGRLAEISVEAEAYAKRHATPGLVLDNPELWLRLDAEMQSAQYQILRWLAWQSDNEENKK